MSRKFLKRIIREELDEIFDEPGRLYVFDFDDTLVTDTATVYVIQPNGNRIPLTHTEFHHYNLKPGERMDFGEFETVGEPHVHEELMRKLLRHLPNSAILTARSKAKPIKDYLQSVGVDVPEIIAVGGERTPGVDIVLRDAKRKRDWIDNAIRTRNLKYVEFWDDNLQNVYQARKLKKKYPNVTIIVHRVRHR